MRRSGSSLAPPLILAASLAACTGDPAEPDMRIAPTWAEAGTPTSPYVHGHNPVWSRGGLGLWDDAAGAIDEAAPPLRCAPSIPTS
jgi:hypothetical protein